MSALTHKWADKCCDKGVKFVVIIDKPQCLKDTLTYGEPNASVRFVQIYNKLTNLFQKPHEVDPCNTRPPLASQCPFSPKLRQGLLAKANLSRLPNHSKYLTQKQMRRQENETFIGGMKNPQPNPTKASHR